MPRRNRSYIIHPHGPSQPVEKLKFAVVDDQERIVSAVWTVFPAHNPSRPDIYVTASGTHSSAKFSFHRDVLNHSVLAEAHADLVARGVVPPGSRHHQQLPIPQLPWHGLTLRLIPELLRKKGHSPDNHKGTIVALPPPPSGRVLEIGFILAEGQGLSVHNAHGALGEVVSGGRSLVVVFAYREHDVHAMQTHIDGAVKQAVIPPQAAEAIDPDMDLAMMLYGQEQGFMTVTEVHNVRFRRQTA